MLYLQRQGWSQADPNSSKLLPVQRDTLSRGKKVKGGREHSRTCSGLCMHVHGHVHQNTYIYALKHLYVCTMPNGIHSHHTSNTYIPHMHIHHTHMHISQTHTICAHNIYHTYVHTTYTCTSHTYHIYIHHTHHTHMYSTHRQTYTTHIHI